MRLLIAFLICTATGVAEEPVGENGLPRPVERRVDFATEIQGNGLDAELMRSYFAAWGDREAYAVSHLGWGMNPGARWDAMPM